MIDPSILEHVAVGGDDVEHSPSSSAAPTGKDTRTDYAIPQTSTTSTNSYATRSHSITSNDNADNVSLASTDYASTISEDYNAPMSRPNITKTVGINREDRPRMGRLKTVGRVEPVNKPEVVIGDVRYREAPKKQAELGIPAIDFGPTYSYDPNKSTAHPGSTDPMASTTGEKRAASRERLHSGQNTPDRLSPYSSPRISPVNSAHVRKISTSTINSVQLSVEDLSLQEMPSRHMRWKPGMGSQTIPLSRQSLTAEEWVQLRASSATPNIGQNYIRGHKISRSTPNIYRQPSMERLTPTPPPVQRERAPSPSSRPPTREGMGSRCHSRNASLVIATPKGHGAESTGTRLSAREQEYVSRMTGTPLVSPPAAKITYTEASAGLVGAIAERERERKAIKEGVGNVAVQNAVFARQNQQKSQAYAQQVSAQANLVQLQQQQLQQLQQRQIMAGYLPAMNPNASSIFVRPMTPGGYSSGVQTPSPGMQQQQSVQQAPSYFPQQTLLQQIPAGSSAMSVMGGPITPQQGPVTPQPYGASWDAQQQYLQQQQRGRHSAQGYYRR